MAATSPPSTDMTASINADIQITNLKHDIQKRSVELRSRTIWILSWTCRINSHCTLACWKQPCKTWFTETLTPCCSLPQALDPNRFGLRWSATGRKRQTVMASFFPTALMLSVPTSDEALATAPPLSGGCLHLSASKILNSAVCNNFTSGLENTVLLLIFHTLTISPPSITYPISLKPYSLHPNQKGSHLLSMKIKRTLHSSKLFTDGLDHCRTIFS